MARRIILLSDGTGNSSAKIWRTNVWRTFEALDLSGSNQVAFYDDGVGTSSFKPWAILGGAFGFGLTGPAGQTVVVDASTDLANWLPIWTNTFMVGALQFSDPNCGVYSQRFYRARRP